MPTIHIAAARIANSQGRLLLVRKRGTTAFMQAGGKIAPGETPRAALLRELAEELGLVVAADTAEYLGQVSAPAANEPGHQVVAELFAITTDAPVAAHAEIAELAWIDPDAPGDLPLAPLTRNHVLNYRRSSRT